jgi:hypothetical protein
VKATLGDAEVASAEAAVKEGLDWLGSSGDSAEVDELKDKQKEFEERLRPVMMKLYGNKEEPAANGSGPVVEEVD